MNYLSKILSWLEEYSDKINQIIWGPLMLLLLLGIGVYITVRTNFFQLTKWKPIWKFIICSLFEKKKDSQKSISPFQATATALAGTMGTGNIVGIATAITAGGAGAIFWMWVSAFFGMMTKYAEIVLAVKFRTTNQHGELVGGPMYYIEKGLKQKWLAVLFAVFCTLASFGIGNMTQVNAISQTLSTSFGIQPMVVGIVCALLAGLVILGGMKRITSITTALIPVLSIGYMVGCILSLYLNRQNILPAFALILEQAFDWKSAGGGILGYMCMNAVKFGVSRGVFSNEAGLGSAPIAHAASCTENPVKQGMWGIFEVFADTIVVCTLTALVILTSGAYLNPSLDGSDLTTAAFSNTLGDFSGIFLSIAVTLFAFATLISWCYYGEKSVEYLFQSERAIRIYRSIYIILAIVGAVIELKLVWNISDTLNGLMAIPNLIALVSLSGIVIRDTKNSFRTARQ